MDISIMVDGVRIDLTPEQVAKLTEKTEEKNPFEWAENKAYYYVTSSFEVVQASGGPLSIYYYKPYFDVGNYCSDKDIMHQHALHMKLNNLLWRFSMTHGGDKIDWPTDNPISGNDKYCIYIDVRDENWYVCGEKIYRSFGEIHFCSREAAEAAIEEVVNPFIEANPDFDWRKM